MCLEIYLELKNAKYFAHSRTMFTNNLIEMYFSQMFPLKSHRELVDKQPVLVDFHTRDGW